MAGTAPLIGSKTSQGGGEIGRKPLLMSENPIFTGKKGSYEVLGDQRIGGGGESQVFLARDLSSGAVVVAKIYDKFLNTKSNRDNRKQVVEFVQAHSDYKRTHIMPILDSGWILVNEVGEEFPFSYPIDILPFCKDGEIKKATFSELKQTIIPQILSAIHLMHTANLAHRDIKPGNIYRYNDAIVVADFGTSCAIGEYDMIGTRTRRGTLGYTAPEVWQGYVVTASDYYSLGCTIATLYKGEHVYQHLLDLNEESALNKLINENGLPLNCPPGEESLQVLVDALTIMKDGDRVGYEEVQLWLSDPRKFEQKYKHSRRSTEEKHFEINFNGVTCYSEQELASLMGRNWEYSKRDLFSRYSMIPGFYSTVNATKGREIGNVIEAKETARNHDLGLAQILHLIYEKGPLYWRGKAYADLSAVSEAIEQNSVPENDIDSMLESRYVSWKLSKNPNASEKTIQGVKRIEEIAQRYKRLARFCAKYWFSPAADQQTFHGLKSPDEIFAFITKDAKQFNQDGKLYSDDDMLAYLAFCGFGANVMNFKEELGDDTVKNTELAYRFFEKICKDKTRVREYYMNYGPRSYMTWVKRNLNLYSFNSPEAKQLRAKIANEPLDQSQSVDELSVHFLNLTQFQKDFLRLFHNNILLAFLGIGNGKDFNGITSANSDAYFLENYCGNLVPAGYFRFLDRK